MSVRGEMAFSYAATATKTSRSGNDLATSAGTRTTVASTTIQPTAARRLADDLVAGTGTRTTVASTIPTLARRLANRLSAVHNTVSA